MTRVEEHWSRYPFDQPPQVWRRDEELLLAEHLPSRKVVRDHEPLQVIHYTPTFQETQMGHPRPVFESLYLRLEWQTMPSSRQPFYHRNTDVDELSLQVDGERSLITDRGTIEMRRGDYACMPVGTAHDNFGRGDIHVLIYTPTGIKELGPVDRQAEMIIPPGDWEPTQVNELVTECLGGPEHDIVMYPANELDIWENPKYQGQYLNVLRADDTPTGTTWMYQSDHIMIGDTRLKDEPGLVYTLNTNCEEVQYQIEGERLLISQRGMVRIVAGDFVRIPIGVAYTSISRGESRHMRICSATTYMQHIEDQECVRAHLPQIAESTGEAGPIDFDAIAKEREGL